MQEIKEGTGNVSDIQEKEENGSFVKNWFSDNFRIGFSIVGVLFVLTFVLKRSSGEGILTINECFTGVFLVIIFFIGAPLLWHVQQKKPEKSREYRDFNPREDILEIEKQFFELGRRVKILKWTPEPRFGEASVAPRNMHFHAEEMSASGVVVPICFSMPVLTRNITYLNTDDSGRLETNDVDWSGALKYDNQPLTRPVYIAKPTYFKPETVTTPKNHSKDDDEDSDGDDEV